MLQIAQKLNAKVMDDNGTIYETPDAWQFTPKFWVTTSSANSQKDSKVAATAQRCSTLSLAIRPKEKIKISKLIIFIFLKLELIITLLLVQVQLGPPNFTC